MTRPLLDIRESVCSLLCRRQKGVGVRSMFVNDLTTITQKRREDVKDQLVVKSIDTHLNRSGFKLTKQSREVVDIHVPSSGPFR
jgi:hypothetical protein